MPIVTKNPDTTVSSTPGVWTMTPPTGSTVAAILSDALDSTYLSTTAVANSAGRYATFDIADVTTSEIPVGSKIKAVTVKVRVLQVAPAGGSSFLGDIIRLGGEIIEVVTHAVLGGFLQNLFSHLFNFPVPTPAPGTSASFQTTTQRTYPERPSGGEWTLDAINELTWNLTRLDSSGQLAKVSKWFIEIEYNERPVATATAVTSPVDDTTRPLFRHGFSDPEGDPQEAFQWKVFTAAQVAAGTFDVETTAPFAASGWLVSAGTQWLCNRDLPNDDYTAFVQVRQQWTGLGMHVSLWDDVSFTMDVEGPPQPILTATPNDSGSWVYLAATPSGPDPVTETYNFYFSDNSGIDWDVVWGGWQRAADGAGGAALIDYLAPSNQNRWYKVISYRTLPLNSIKVASEESERAEAMQTRHEFRFSDPFAPSLNMDAAVNGDDPSSDLDQDVVAPLGAPGVVTNYVVINRTLRGIKGEMQLIFVDVDDTEWLKLKALRKPGHTIAWFFPTGEWHWIKLGQLKWSWKTDGKTGIDFRQATFGYAEVEKPLDPSLGA